MALPFLVALSCTLFSALSLLSCRQAPKPMDLSRADWVSALPYRCHTVFQIRPGPPPFLQVQAFAGEYPGLEARFLNGDWSRSRSLVIEARMAPRDSAIAKPLAMKPSVTAMHQGPRRFALTVWDGQGPYVHDNRYTRFFELDTAWKRFEVPVGDGLKTPKGRSLNLKRIERVIFFTGSSGLPLSFDIAAFGLKS